MEAPEPSCPTPAPDQPSPAPGPLGVLGGQASPRLTLGPVLLPPDQGLPPTVILKALPIPLYHTVPPGGLQPRAPLVTGSLDGATLPFILSPGLQPEGPGPGQAGKPAGPALTVSIVGALPMLSPGQGATLGSSGRVRNAGKYLCPHCGRDCLKPSVLEKHIRSHTGERPFPCAACGIAFKTQSNLYKHRRSQTHLNNSRLSLESEGSGGSLLEEGERAGELVMADNRGEEEKTLSPGVHVTLATKNLEAKMAASPCPVSALAYPLDSAQTASPQPWRKLPEPKPCSLQRQQDTVPEKPCDSKALEGRLRKCESTDSGYLSRSDSAEQPPVACSPLHSLSEHSAESEGEGASSAGSGGPRAERGTPGSSLELEKKRLEERIAQLISHNQAVVEDPQLDHVRPRKTVLSKQGSIDLPMPYTYKDSFHFDIRAQEPGRRRAALGPARSTYTPLDKSRPLFFHSVPTQLSTTVECVPVTRSNSMPFIEGSKLWLEPQDQQDTCPKVQKPLSPKLVPTRPGCHSGLTLADIPSGHPRALVRQAAVEDLLCAPTGDPSAPAEEQEGKKTAAGEGAACKGRAGKKYSQGKSKMFSQEKWQVYGHETFKRIYQKMKTSHGGQKARELRVGQGTELDLPPQGETPGRESTAPSRDHGTPILSDGSGSTKSGSWGSRLAPEHGTEKEPPKQLKAVARAKSSPILGIKDGPCVGSRNPLIPPTGRLDLGCQLPPVPGSIHEGGAEVPQLTLPDLKLEGDIPGRGDTKETCPWTQTVLSLPSRGTAAPQSTEDKLPLERKRPKVEGQEQTGPPKSEMPGRLYERTSQGAATLESSGASSAAARGWLGPADKGSPLPSASRSPEHRSQPSAQPQAARVLAALSDSTFAPKYLLRLPQGESSSAPSMAGPGQGREALCTGECPEERGPLSQSASRMPGLPGSACAAAPGEAGSTLEEPSWPETRHGKEAQMKREKRDGMNSSTPAAGDPLGSATEAIGDTTSILPTCTHDTHLAQSLAGETQAIPHHLRTVSSSAGTSISGGHLSPWTPIQELGASLKNTPEGFPVQHETRPTSRSPFQARCFLASLTNPPDVPQGRPQSALTPHLETSGSCRAQSSFPSLKAEPQLTWCCLNRSLALPVERERAASGHAALQVPDGNLRAEGHCAPSGSSGGRTGTSFGGRGPAQTSKVSHTVASGTRPQDPLWDLKWKKGPRLRRAKTSRGNSRQKKLRLHPKRYEGGFWQSRTQLRASRLRKTAWVPRGGCRPPPVEGTLGKETLGKTSPEVAALNLQGGLSCNSAELALGHGNEGRKEDGYGRISGAMSPSSSTRTVETDNSVPQDLCPSAGEHGGCSQEKETERSRFSLQSSACLEAATEDPVPQGQDLDIGPLGTQLLSSHDQVSTDPTLRAFPDAPEPSCFGSKGIFPHPDIATSAEAVCVSSGVRTECEPLEVHDVESRAGETLEQSSPDRRIIAEITPWAHLPGKPSSGQRISGLARLGPPGKNHLEVSASGPSSTSSQHAERRPRADFLSGAQCGCGDLVISCPTLGNDGGKCPASGSLALMGHTPPPDPEQPLELPGAPSRSIRKRSLEGMRKQTRVELSDSSSDDEDRLVIEM